MAKDQADTLHQNVPHKDEPLDSVSLTPDSAVSGWRLWLQQRAENERANLRLFVSGAAAFFVGLGGVLYADQRLLPSITQELLAGSGLFLSAVGGLLALSGYILLSFSRIFRVVRTDEKNHD